MLDERDRAAIEELQTEEVRGHKRRKPTGRKPIPDDLPRVDIEILPPEVEREGLDAFERVGEEVSEVLPIRNSVASRSRSFRTNFGRTMRATTTDAGRRSYRRDGLSLGRSTICNWHMQLASLAEPLIAAMRADAFAQPYLCTDATGVLVQAKDKCRRAHFWVMVAPEKHVLFEYTRDHTNDAVDSILAGYEVYLWRTRTSSTTTCTIDDGARANGVFTSLLASCRMLGLEPWSYLRDLLCLLPE